MESSQSPDLNRTEYAFYILKLSLIEESPQKKQRNTEEAVIQALPSITKEESNSLVMSVGYATN